MNANELTHNPNSIAQRQARMRMAGIAVLVLGLTGASAVYWTGSPPVDYSDDPSTAHAYKMESRNLEINLGRMGLLTNDLLTELQHPGVQALLIAGAAALVAGGCFYIAHLMERTAEDEDPTS
jgi:hypothetical protein